MSFNKILHPSVVLPRNWPEVWLYSGSFGAVCGKGGSGELYDITAAHQETRNVCCHSSTVLRLIDGLGIISLNYPFYVPYQLLT